MKSLKLIILFACPWLFNCGGSCPTIAIPLYEVSVYDSSTNELLCWDRLSIGTTNKSCEILAENYKKDDATTANITVKLDGYQTKTLSNVPNQSGIHRCFDQPEYTTKIDVYLEKSE